MGSAPPLLLLLLGALRGTPAPQLLHPHPAAYHGPPGSYFGFALDFHVEDGRVRVAVGAPRANTSQPNVTEPGAVFLCSWPPERTSCQLLPIDTAGDEAERSGAVRMRLFKSRQWLGAAVRSWRGAVIACAPLQHWNAHRGDAQSFRSPVGACYVGRPRLRRFAWIAPCRDTRVAASYRDTGYVLDQRYCEFGFSADVTADGTLALGAPGGYYFMGLLFVVDVGSVLSRFPNSSLLWPHSPGRPTAERAEPEYSDAYRGYSVAVGEFDENPKTKEFVVGVPNKSNTRGEVEIFSAGLALRRLHGIASEQVASYFGHTVAVADVNGDGKDDILVGAPLFVERRAEGKQREVGRLYLYLGGTRRPWGRPTQTLTGTEPYGRFAAAIAPLGDLDHDGCDDVAVGAPFGGADGRGAVLIFRGHRDGVSAAPSQLLRCAFPGAAAFGSALRGGADIDGNGYPDLLVGAYGVSKVAVYRGRPVVVAHARLSVPSALNPRVTDCVLPGSDSNVTCFPVELCVAVSGQRIPQSVELRLQLQLDRLKHRGQHRVLLLRGHRAEWRRTVNVTAGGTPLCHSHAAFLRAHGDFRDKLSPIVTGLHVALPDLGPDDLGPDDLGPVLRGDTHVQAQTHLIFEDCGDDHVCVPDLRLSAHTAVPQLWIGADNALSLHACAANAGEGAFEAELRVRIPHGTDYRSAISAGRDRTATEKLSCSPRRDNGTHVVLCEMGNPMRAGAQISVAIELSVSGLEDAEDAVTFHLELRSKNSPSVTATVTVPVEAHAEMELRGMSLPASTVLPAEQRRSGDGGAECGVHVEHVYQLHNRGPGAVTDVTVHLHVPVAVGHRAVLRLLELSTDGGIGCVPPPGLNYTQLEEHRPTGVGLSNGTRPRERRDVWGEEENVTVHCGSATCVAVRCGVGSVARGHRVLVAVRALLCGDALREGGPHQLSVHSWGSFNASAMPYRVRPHTLPHGTATAVTVVLRAPPGAVPAWWVLLGGLGGLLLLALLALLMGKMGFFKRTRPPEEGGAGDGAEPGGGSG